MSEEPLLEISVEHERMETTVGSPALIEPGEAYPAVQVVSCYDGMLEAVIVYHGDDSSCERLAGCRLNAGKPLRLIPENIPRPPGLYEIRLRFLADSLHEAHDTVYFTVRGPEQASGRTVYTGSDGKLVYVPDLRGNRIPDFSHVGYMAGDSPIPDVPSRVVLEAGGEMDDTGRIQAAIDEISRYAPDANGLRGAVLLRKGTYRVYDKLRIHTGGIVLRGEGPGENGTVLVAAGKERRTLIEVAGKSGPQPEMSSQRRITDLYVPVGARSFHVEMPHGFRAGDAVLVRREGNADFIRDIGMDRIMERPGQPGSTKQWEPFHLDFDRVISRVEGSLITVDGPIVAAVESRWGGGSVIKYTDSDRIEQAGVENLRGVSEFDPQIVNTINGKPYLADEDHAWGFISFDNVKNGWARYITGVHFARDVARVDRGAKWITVQDCESLDMVSVLTGGRRYPFFIAGQLALFQRLFACGGRHSFAFHSRVCGPNVFLHALSSENYASSEPHHRWSVGGLYDNVSGNIAIQDRQYYGSGHGWSGANYVVWNTTGTLVVQKPPTAQNWAIGHVGAKGREAFPPREQGRWESLGEHVHPHSLYVQQLKERLANH